MSDVFAEPDFRGGLQRRIEEGSPFARSVCDYYLFTEEYRRHSINSERAKSGTCETVIHAIEAHQEAASRLKDRLASLGHAPDEIAALMTEIEETIPRRARFRCARAKTWEAAHFHDGMTHAEWGVIGRGSFTIVLSEKSVRSMIPELTWEGICAWHDRTEAMLARPAGE